MASKLNSIRNELNTLFVEREAEVEALLVCLVARQHMLLVGPPGTAKSALVRALCERIGANYFNWLLTKFSTPEELFGPVSLQSLKAGKYERIIAGKLPEAEVAFLDEIFKANSAILNSCLTVLNERLYHNNGGAVKCPLQFAVGASNEFPQGEELGALFDRFLVRFVVQYISEDAGFEALLKGSSAKLTKLSAKELEAEQTAAAAVTVPDKVLAEVVGLRRALGAEGIVVSDRRWRESLGLVRAAAHLAGRVEAENADLEVLCSVLWSDPAQRDKVAEVVMKVANPFKRQALEFADEVTSIFADKDVNSADAVTEIRKKLKDTAKRVAEAVKVARANGADTTALVAVEDRIKAENKALVAKFLDLEG